MTMEKTAPSSGITVNITVMKGVEGMHHVTGTVETIDRCLPKRQSLNVITITRKYQTNPHSGTFYKIPDL